MSWNKYQYISPHLCHFKKENFLEIQSTITGTLLEDQPLQGFRRHNIRLIYVHMVFSLPPILLIQQGLFSSLSFFVHAMKCDPPLQNQPGHRSKHRWPSISLHNIDLCFQSWSFDEKLPTTCPLFLTHSHGKDNLWMQVIYHNTTVTKKVQLGHRM